MAADQGYRDSEYDLGCFYKEGETAPVDNFKARLLFESASARGHPGAQLHLGTFHRDGKAGLVVNHTAEAVRFLTLSAHSMDGRFSIGAQRYLAEMYNSHAEVQDLELAAYWYEKLLKREDLFDRINLGILKGILRCDLARVLLDLYSDQFALSVGGPCPYPRVLRILHAVPPEHDDEADRMRGDIKQLIKEQCSYCGNTNTRLQECVRCKAAHYCGRNWQVKHYVFHKGLCRETE